MAGAIRCLPAAVLFGVGLFLLGQGLYINAKARVAQHLLNAAWQQTMAGKTRAKPWPWADTWPVAKLSIERLGVDQVVMAGAHGEALAFGPGLVGSGELRQDFRNIILAGHRDTHFHYLRRIERGDVVRLTAPGGHSISYVVTDAAVFHEADTEILTASDAAALTLITCYPFDSLRPGGPLRYVVRGEPITDKWSSAPTT